MELMGGCEYLNAEEEEDELKQNGRSEGHAGDGREERGQSQWTTCGQGDERRRKGRVRDGVQAGGI